MALHKYAIFKDNKSLLIEKNQINYWFSLIRAFQLLPWDSYSWHFMYTRNTRNLVTLAIQKKRILGAPTKLIYQNPHYRDIINILVSSLQQSFTFHGSLKPIFFPQNSSLSPVFFKRLYLRWSNFSFFMLNVFYYGGQVFSFGNPLIRKEIEACNWSRKRWQIHEWLWVKSHFSLQTKRASEGGSFFIYKLSLEWNCVCLFTHPSYNSSMIHYLRRHNIPLIGLIDSSINPWWFFYTLPIPFLSVATQLISLRLIMALRKLAMIKTTNALV